MAIDLERFTALRADVDSLAKAEARAASSVDAPLLGLLGLFFDRVGGLNHRSGNRYFGLDRNPRAQFELAMDGEERRFHILVRHHERNIGLG